jgi:hypothetical protein
VHAFVVVVETIGVMSLVAGIAVAVDAVVLAICLLLCVLFVGLRALCLVWVELGSLCMVCVVRVGLGVMSLLGCPVTWCLATCLVLLVGLVWLVDLALLIGAGFHSNVCVGQSDR